MPKPHVIEVYADLWCPFAYVGLLAATTTSAVTEGRVQLGLRSWPLELVNNSPLPQEKTWANAKALRDSVAPELFSGIDHWSYPRSTLLALGLAAQATATDLTLGCTVSLHLRQRLFEEGADLSSAKVLDEVAKHFNLERSGETLPLVMAEYRTGQQRGVTGSPHFFCDRGEDLFCPTLDLSRDEEGNLHVRQMMRRLEGFFARCASD